MSIKILGGSAKGIDLVVPPNSITKPTSVMLKRKLFDSIQNFEGKCFIDLCAGTGSMGLEALSRGADIVFFVEKSKKAFQILKQNHEKLKRINNLGEVILEKKDSLLWLKSFFSKDELQRHITNLDCVIFFDPPYENVEMYKEVYQLLLSSSFKGKFIFEACHQKSFKLEDWDKEFSPAQKVFKQGTSFFAIYDFN